MWSLTTDGGRGWVSQNQTHYCTKNKLIYIVCVSSDMPNAWGKLLIHLY